MTGCLITNARILNGTGRTLFAGAVRAERPAQGTLTGRPA
jgi:hypothetical protein